MVITYAGIVQVWLDMDFIDKIKELSARIPDQIDHIQTEEATKNAFVMPFIAALEYNVFDPREVLPEFTADIGAKKGEKVDYAILRDDKPAILFECKFCGADLEKEHATQLYRYFIATEAHFGVLTNGIIYHFYSDLEKPNVMDEKPFLEFNMLDIEESLVGELKKFTKTTFDLDSILTTAVELKYTKELMKLIDGELRSPSDEFVKFFASQVYSGRLTPPVREQFSELTSKAFKQVISNKINDRLKEAARLSEENVLSERATPEHETVIPNRAESQSSNGIITTEDELEGYYVIKTILREAIDADRVNIRDTKSYCGIILDDNNRKPICRLYYNSQQKHIDFFDEQKNIEAVPIDNVDDIYKYADRLKAIVAYYDKHYDDPKGKSFRGTSITSFEFNGTRYEASSWKDMYLQICNIMLATHKDQFEEVLKLSGRKRPYFSRDPNDLRSAERINGTELFVEVSLSADRVVKLSRNVISLFGYSEDELSVEVDK